MHKIKNQRGFSLIETLVITSVVIVLAIVGWLVYKDNTKSTPAKVTTKISTPKTNSSPSKTSTSTSESTTTPKPGPAQYCTTSPGFCFEYPAGWTTDSNGDIKNANGLYVLHLICGYNGGGDGALPGPYQIVAVNSLEYLTGFSSVEAIELPNEGNSYDNSYEDYYEVLPNSEIQQYGVVAGKTINLLPAQWTDNNINKNCPAPGEDQVYIAEYPVDGGFGPPYYSTLSSAEAWFNNSQVKQAGQILNSVVAN